MKRLDLQKTIDILTSGNRYSQMRINLMCLTVTGAWRTANSEYELRNLKDAIKLKRLRHGVGVYGC